MKIFNPFVEKKLQILKTAEEQYFKTKEKILREAESKEENVRKQILKFSDIENEFNEKVKEIRIIYEKNFKNIDESIKNEKEIILKEVNIEEQKKVNEIVELIFEEFNKNKVDILKNSQKEAIQKLNEKGLSEIKNYIQKGEIYIEELKKITVQKAEKLKEKVITELKEFQEILPNELKNIKKEIRIEKLVSIFVDKDFDRFRSKKYTTEIYDRNKGSWDIFEATDEKHFG